MLKEPERLKSNVLVNLYSDASVVVLAPIGRLWTLSGRAICDWLVSWPASGAACGLRQGRATHHSHLNRRLLALRLHVVRADGGYWGSQLVRFIVTVIKAHPIIPFNRKKQPLARVRHLVYWPVSYAARAIIERFFAAAKRYYHLDTSYAMGWESVLLRVTLTFCAILAVALAAYQSGAPELRLSPTRVLAHYLPVQGSLEVDYGLRSNLLETKVVLPWPLAAVDNYGLPCYEAAAV